MSLAKAPSFALQLLAIRVGPIHTGSAQQSVQGPLSSRLCGEWIHHERYRDALKLSPIKYHLCVVSLLDLLFIFIAIMRSFSLMQEVIIPYIPTLIGQLTQKLLLVSKVIHTCFMSICCTQDISMQRAKCVFCAPPTLRIPASPILTTTCLSPCACPSGSPARPTPARWAALRRPFSPCSQRSFRTMSRVGH